MAYLLAKLAQYNTAAGPRSSSAAEKTDTPAGAGAGTGATNGEANDFANLAAIESNAEKER